jgi:hypothetical protein
VSDIASCPQCAEGENIKFYKITWREIHSVSAVIDACSPEHAIEKAKSEDVDDNYDVDSEDAFGPVIPDSYKCELFESDHKY